MTLKSSLKKSFKLIRGIVAQKTNRIYYSICQRRYNKSLSNKKSNNFSTCKEKFDRDGFVQSNFLWLDEISEEVEHKFSSRKSNCLYINDSKFVIAKDWASPKYSYCYLTPDSILSLKIIDRFLDSDDFKKAEFIRNTLLKVVNVALWKTDPLAFYNDGSFVWHRDSMPKSGIKCLYYLSNVNKDSGPLVILPNTYKNHNYIPGYTPSRVYDLDYEHQNSFKILGKTGSGLIFDTNNLHYAGRTTSDPITILSFSLQPHHEDGREFYFRNGCGFAPLSKEFSIFPWSKWWKNN